MAVIKNQTARILILPTRHQGARLKLSLVPGFNLVADEIWDAFVSTDEDGNEVIDDQVERLQLEGDILFGDKLNEMELDVETHADPIVNKTPIPDNQLSDEEKAEKEAAKNPPKDEEKDDGNEDL